MDDVDVYVGLMVETHASDSLVGPTLANLLGSQFRDIKFGDRFFYESKRQSGSFTKGRCRPPGSHHIVLFFVVGCVFCCRDGNSLSPKLKAEVSGLLLSTTAIIGSRQESDSSATRGQGK